MDPRLRAAVDANVGWYGDLCCVHGVAATLRDGLWASSTAPPPLHSDVVVVEPTVTGTDVLDRLAGRARCGVKDSFASLDLTGAAFRVLFEATWLHRPAPTEADPGGWGRVTTPAELAAWTALHDTAEVLLPGVLGLAHLEVLAKRVDGRIVAGAVARLGTGVVDVSNTYAVPGEELDWGELSAVIGARFPGRPLVGYTGGAELTAATDAGFVPVGPLRVWVR
jgi:hypothetical protein